MPLETFCCSLAGCFFFLFQHLANLYQSSFRGSSPQRPRVSDRRPGARTGLVSTMLVLAVTIASRRNAGKCRPHCKTRFTNYPVCWDIGVDIEIVPKWILSRLNEICRGFQRAEYRPGLVYNVYVMCCMALPFKTFDRNNVFGIVSWVTFGWLMCFSFCVCWEDIVNWNHWRQYQFLQWMLVLLWCLHIDGVVYYFVSHCLNLCQWHHSFF